MTDPILKVRQLPPGWQIMGQFLDLMCNAEKYAERMAEFQAAHDGAALIVDKVGKASEIDGLHAAAVTDRDESNAILAKAERAAKAHTASALEAKTSLIRQGAAERKELMTECEAKCDALKTETQDRVDAANQAMRAATTELADRKGEVKSHEAAVRKATAKVKADRATLDADRADLDRRVSGLDQALASSKNSNAKAFAA